MKTRNRKNRWTLKNTTTVALLLLSASMALVGCPWYSWTSVCNLATLMMLDVI